MKKHISLIALAFALNLSTGLKAQDSTMTSNPGARTFKAATKTEWVVGLHGIVVDDDGDRFGNLFNVGKSWNFVPYPSRVTVEKRLEGDFRIEAAIAYSNYKAGKTINDNPLKLANSFFAIDVNAKYDFITLLGGSKYVDPFATAGLGYTMRPALYFTKNTPTVNFGLGCNFWIYQGFGLQIQTMAKMKLISKSSNYLQHTLGVVYQIGYLKSAEPKEGSIRQQM